jgi:hypothetical protein
MTKLSTRSLAIAFATRMRYAEDFDTHGALKGRAGTPYLGLGRLPREHEGDVREADYVVYSYATPIAWHSANGWTLPDVRYSVTTSAHQSKIGGAISLI